MGDLDPEAEALDRFYAEFARRVRAAREAAGLSQSALERLAKVHPCAVSAIERGETRDLGLLEVVRIAGALAVPVADLIPAPDEPNGEPDDESDEPGRSAGIVQWD